MTISDEDLTRLLQRAQRHDPAAFDRLYELYADRIYRYVWYRVRDRELAEDLTAEIFVQMMQSLPTFRIRSSGTVAGFSGWLYRIAHNYLHHFYRRGEREEKMLRTEEKTHPPPAPTQTPTVTPTRTRVLPALPTATAPATSELPDLRLVDEVQLTRREYAVFRAWLPDGERILFSLPRPPEASGDDRGIWVMNRDGSAQQQLGVGRWPAFSPDGRRVAYTAGAGDDRSVWIVSVMGGEPQQVAGGATGRVFWPTDDTLWYPTAEGLRAVRLTPAGAPAGEPELRLPLAGLVEEDAGWVQWSVAPGGGAVLVGTSSRWWLVRLTPGEAPRPELLPAHSIWTEAWTRDGAALAFVGEGKFLAKGIYLLGTDGRSGARLLVPQRALDDRTGGIIRSLNWSPDGSRLLVEWWSGSMGAPSRLYVVDRAGNQRLLVGLDDHETLHWSPDGEWMAFHRAGNVWVARVEGR